MQQVWNRPRLVLFGLFVLLCWVSSGAVLAADRRVAVRPFEVYNAADLEASIPGLQAALASRLNASGCQVFTVKAGEPFSADWAVRVTVTRVGSRMSVDGAAEPVSGQGELIRAYETAESADGLFTALTNVATSLRKAILSAPLPVARPIPPPSPASPAAPAAPVAPVTQFAPAPQSPATTLPGTISGPEAAQPFVTEAVGISKSLASYRFTAPASGVALSLAAGDVDRDGLAEVLVLTAKEIIAFRDDGREVREAWRSKVGRDLRPAYLSIGDGDGDGIPEIFVAGVGGDVPSTEVYQWSAGRLAPHGPAIPAFVRAVNHPDQGLLLIGMGSESGHLFGSKIKSYKWSNGGYREQGILPTPLATLVTDVDWHRLKDGQPPWTVQTTQDDTLKIFDDKGKVVFSGGDEVKGSENILESGDQQRQDRLAGDVYRLQGRTVAWRDSTGTPNLILQKNYAFTTAFKRSRSYSKGQILAYRWDGLALTQTGQGPKFPGFFADIDSLPNRARPGGTTLYAVLNQSEGILLTTKTLRVLAWDL